MNKQTDIKNQAGNAIGKAIEDNAINSGNLEETLGIRSQAEKIIIDKVKELVLDFMRPEKRKEVGKKYYWERYFRRGITGETVAEYKIAQYIKEDCNKQFTDNDVHLAIDELEREKKIKSEYATYWCNHEDVNELEYKLR